MDTMIESPNQSLYYILTPNFYYFPASEYPDNSYFIVNPPLLTSFQVQAPDLFLCTLFDGTRSLSEIVELFSLITTTELDEIEFIAFINKLICFGYLLPSPNRTNDYSALALHKSCYTRLVSTPVLSDTRLTTPDFESITDTHFILWIWSSHDPSSFLQPYVSCLDKAKWLILLIALLSIPCTLLTIGIISHNIPELNADYTYHINSAIPNLFLLLILSGFHSSAARFCAAILAHYYGNTPTTVRFGLLLGFTPRLFVSCKFKYFSPIQLRNFSLASLLARIYILFIAAILWQLTYAFGTNLSYYCYLTLLTGLIGLFTDIVPFWPSPGYYLIVTSFSCYDFYYKTFALFSLLLKRLKSPREITQSTKLFHFILGSLIFLSLSLIYILQIYFLSFALSDLFLSHILGEGAVLILILLFSLYTVFALFNVFKKLIRSSNHAIS